MVHLEAYASVEVDAETEDAAIEGALDEVQASRAASWIVSSVDEVKTPVL